MSTKTVTFSILKADQSPDAFGWVDVRLVDAGGGGVIVDGAIAKRARVQLDANGEGQVDLVPNDEIAPDGTFYRVTVERSSPTVVRAIQLTSSTASPVAWTDASIQVLSPVPPDWVPIEGGGSAPTDMQIVDLTGETPDGDGIVRFDLADLDRTTALLSVAVPEDAILKIEGTLDGPRGLLAIAVVGDGYPVAVQEVSNLFVPDSLGAHAVTGVLAPTTESGMGWVAWSAVDSGGNLIEFSGGVEAPLAVDATGYAIVADAIDVDLSGIGEGVTGAFITAPDHTGTLTVNVTLPGVAARRELVVMAAQQSLAHDVQIAADATGPSMPDAAPIVVLALTKWTNTDGWFVSAASRYAADGSLIGGGSGPDLSDATPADLGTAAAGTSPDASRADHVHDLPTPGDIGAATASHSHAASAITSGTIDIARIPTGTTSTTVPLGNDARFSDARTPTAHKTSHQSGGSDELTLAQSQVTNLTTDLAAKVPKSLVDAKGDLIAATADDTPARLAVGADGLPVIADSAQSIGLAYGVPSTGSGHYRDNEHYLLSRTGGRLGGSTGYAPGANKVVTWDIEILEPVKLDGEWFYVQTANTGAKMRVGIYAKSTTTGHPTGNPLVTCTEIDASTTSYKTDTFTKTGWIMPGLYAGLLATNDGTAAYRAPAIVQTVGDPACDLGRGTGTITPYLSWIASWTYSSSALPDVSAFTWTASTTIAAPFVAWKVRRS